MVSRMHLNADGSPKTPLTKSAAQARITGCADLKAYYCPVCKHWHTGHSNGTRRRTEWNRMWDHIRTELEITT